MLQPAQLNVCNLTYSEPSGCRSNTSVAMLQGGLPRSPARVRNEGTHLEKKTLHQVSQIVLAIHTASQLRVAA
jgi:hypothetical protein